MFNVRGGGGGVGGSRGECVWEGECVCVRGGGGEGGGGDE